MVIAVCSLAVAVDRERGEVRAAFGSAGPVPGLVRLAARRGRRAPRARSAAACSPDRRRARNAPPTAATRSRVLARRARRRGASRHEGRAARSTASGARPTSGPGESLLFTLRERLGLPGSKNACEQGECGSCSVLLDGQLVCSCLVLAAQADGHDVVTVEGLAARRRAPSGAGRVRRGGSGAVRLLHARARRRRGRPARREPDPSDDEIREALSGNLCRCTGYQKIVEAVQRRRRSAHEQRRAPDDRCARRRLERGRVGESVARVGRRSRRSTGEFAYSSDLEAPGMLWGHTLRSPHAHARIRAIDISEALALPGVHAVLTHEDVPGREDVRPRVPRPAGARDRPRALLRRAGRDRRRRASRAGATRGRADRRRLRAARAGRRPGARDGAGAAPPGPADRRARLPRRPAAERRPLDRHPPRRPGRRRRGDVSTASTRSATQDQAFLGPESGLAVPDGEGGVDIYVATQWTARRPRPDRAVPRARARSRCAIHLAGVGGAFGGREDLSIQIHARACSRSTPAGP